jgi:Fe-S-cluster-containing dehydrogenase component
MAVKRIFLDPSRCIGCRACVTACRECDTHKGQSMIYIDYINRGNTVATSPSLCMHCEEPVAPCAQVCPAQAILISPDGVVQQADESRCINIRNCVYVCPFGIPKFDTSGNYMRKCNLCYDRTSIGKPPMCSSVCPSQAIFYGTYEEFMQAGRGTQGAKPVNVFYFGRQRVRTRNYVVMHEDDDALDLMALAAEASLGSVAHTPPSTLGNESEPWVEADTAGIPEREAPPRPWAPRTAPGAPTTPAPEQDPGQQPGRQPDRSTPTPERVPTAP